MSKTLVIAEKPSVARDIANALPGRFVNNESFLEGEEYVITFAVGHLVELVNPEDYDDKFKKWRRAHPPLPPPRMRPPTRPADPAGGVPPPTARREVEEAARRDPQADEARRRRPHRQRLRRRARGRAD